MFARCYEMAGLTTKDRVQIAVGYGVWTAGVGFQLGVERLGAMAIPIGPGNIDMQCQFLRRLPINRPVQHRLDGHSHGRGSGKEASER